MLSRHLQTCCAVPQSLQPLTIYHKIHINGQFGEFDDQDIPIYTPENYWRKLYSSSELEDQFSTRFPPFVDFCLQQFEKTM